jgi:hypothetical protein
VFYYLKSHWNSRVVLISSSVIKRQEIGVLCERMIFMICTLAKYNYNSQVKEDEMGRTCSTYDRRGMNIGYRWEKQKDTGHRKDKVVGERVIRKWIVER